MMTSAWTPRDLGPKLLAWWAAPNAANTTLVSGAISSWRDEVGGYDLTQTTAGQRPLFNATSFGGLACAEFDGVDDRLGLVPAPASFPTTAAAEMWVSCRQDEAGGVNRTAFVFGAVSGPARRSLSKMNPSGTSRAVASTEAASSTNASVAFTGIHAARAVTTATHVRMDVDGVAGSAAAVTAATTQAAVRMGSRVDGAAAFWLGGIRQVVMTTSLTTDEAAALYDHLNQGL